MAIASKKKLNKKQRKAGAFYLKLLIPCENREKDGYCTSQCRKEKAAKFKLSAKETLICCFLCRFNEKCSSQCTMYRGIRGGKKK